MTDLLDAIQNTRMPQPPGRPVVCVSPERMAELEEAEAEVERLRGACESVRIRVARIQKQGRIAQPAALWILEKLDAALGPSP